MEHEKLKECIEWFFLARECEETMMVCNNPDKDIFYTISIQGRVYLAETFKCALDNFSALVSQFRRIHYGE